MGLDIIKVKSQKVGSKPKALLMRVYKRIADGCVTFCERGGATLGVSSAFS